MKKILIIPSWYPCIENQGLGTFFLEQNQLLSESNDIRVLCILQKKNLSRIEKIYNSITFLIFRRVKLRIKKNYFIEPPVVYGFEYECGLNVLKKMNHKIVVKAYSQSAKRVFLDWNFTMIHCHDTLYGGIGAYQISKLLKIPYIITEHNYLQFREPEFIKKDFIYAIEEANQLLLVSEYQVRNLFMYGIIRNYGIIGNFVDDSIFKPKKIFNQEGKFNILFIGRNAFHKDLITLWRVIIEFDKLCNSGDFCFLIIGNSFDKVIVNQESLANLKSTGKIEIIPFVERGNIFNFYNKADVYLSTSIAETFGVGICEAMMCGIPVVSTNSGGFDEMFVPGVNGLRTKIGDYISLADSLNKIRTKEIIFDSSKIRESVIEKFGREAFKTKMANVYNNIYE